MSEQAHAVIPLPVLADGLPPAPPAALDPLLDATSICLAARGPSRTSMSDIARELGVAPSTVYRKVGSVDNAAWMLASREAHRFLARLPEHIAGVEGARMVTAFIAAGIRTAREHPVFARVLRDEPEFVGRGITRRLPILVDQVAAVVAPFLQVAMAAGIIRERDPVPLAHWITRVALASVVVPPPGDLQDELDSILLPMLEP